MQHLAKQFRDKAAVTFGAARHRTRYPEELKALARTFIGHARQTGAEEREIAAALGVSGATTRAWLPMGSDGWKGQPALPRPRLVRVVDSAGSVESAAPIARYVVRGPRGLIIECDAQGIAELLQVLS